MGTLTGTALINNVSILLNDTGNIRWSRSELLGWLNDGQRLTVNLKPASNNVVVAVQLVAGTRQALPSNGWYLMDVIRNMGIDGATAGAAIQVTSRKVLDSQNLGWHYDPASNVTQNYIFNPQDPYAYYVYPPSDGTGFIEINYSQVPTALATENAVIAIDDIFGPIITDYMCYRAMSKDSEYAPGMRLAQGYYQAFIDALGGKDKSELENNPNLDLVPRDETVRGSAN